MSEVGVILRRYRMERDLIHKEIAYMAGCSTTYIFHIESGRRLPTMRQLARLAKALGLNDEETFEVVMAMYRDAACD